MRQIILIACLIIALPALANPFLETRYCGEPKRDANGAIIRRADVLAAFQKIHPCPSTGLTTGACAGWQKNHGIPMVCGGCDSVSNIIWSPTILKAGAGLLPIDRWERKVYCLPQVIVTMPVGKNLLLISQ